MIQRLQEKRNEDGFTLIELLIVIIVLGILAAIVVFAVSGTKKDATEATCKTDVKSVELSAESVLAKKPGALDLTSVDSADLYTPAMGGLLKGTALPATDSYTLSWDETNGKVIITDETVTPAAPVTDCTAFGSH